MGFFKKGPSDEAVLVSLLTTFGQSIEVCNKSNGREFNEFWDIFINTVGWLTDGGLISEDALDTVVSLASFPSNHQLTLDLIKIRDSTDSIQKFIQNNKRDLEISWSPMGLGRVEGLTPDFFEEKLTSLTKDSYPKFGKSKSDKAFVSVIAIFVLTVIADSELDSGSNRTFRRITAYDFALRWLSEWNHA